MRPDVQVIPVGEELALPWDLTHWFSPDKLREWIDQEVATLDWQNQELVEVLRTRPNYHPQTMLSLLTYAFATAVFESEEILRRCYGEGIFRSICGSQVPGDARDLTRFRRENRGLLKWSLMQLFKRALKARLGDFRLPAGLKRRLLDAAVARLDLARQMDRGSEGL